MFERFYAEGPIFRANINVIRRFDLTAFVHHLVDEYLSGKRPKDTRTLMARIYATDDQDITEVYAQADADQVPVDAAASPVTVTVVDAGGADVSKWVSVQQDAANPLKFVFSRKPDDGTQPQVLDFTSVGTGAVGGVPAEFRSDLGFTPGTPTTLTSTVTVGSPPVAEPPKSTAEPVAAEADTETPAAGAAGATSTEGAAA